MNCKMRAEHLYFCVEVCRGKMPQHQSTEEGEKTPRRLSTKQPREALAGFPGELGTLPHLFQM